MDLNAGPDEGKTAWVVLFTALLILSGCNSDTPVGPKPVVNYSVYTYNLESSGTYYAYSPSTSQLDSFALPSVAEIGIVLSHDGQSLYLGFRDSVVEYATSSHNRIRALPSACVKLPVPSPDNQKLAAATTGGLVVIDRDSHDMSFAWTGALNPHAFSSGSDLLYASSADTVFVFDLNDSTLSASRRFPSGLVTKVLPSGDDSQWFLYRYLGSCLSSFEVYDVALDLVVFRRQLTPGIGEFELDPVRGLVYITNSDQIISFCAEVPSEVLVYDIQAVAITATMATNHFVNDSTPVSFGCGQIELLPDGGLLVGADPGYNYLIAIDPVLGQVVDYKSIEQGVSTMVQLRSLTCQRGM